MSENVISIAALMQSGTVKEQLALARVISILHAVDWEEDDGDVRPSD